jgi:hypothetical protein
MLPLGAGLMKMSEQEIIAIIQEWPTIIEIYSIDHGINEKVTFRSFDINGRIMSARKCTNTIYTSPRDGRAYFKHFGARYYLDNAIMSEAV